jgi:hypothetical protein
VNTNIKTISKLIKQVYYPYWEWECFHSGMYSRSLNRGLEPDDAKLEYAMFLNDPDRFNKAMDRVAKEWPKSCEHFLTNPKINRIAWLGQSAACIELGISSFYRSGFIILSESEQDKANEIAANFLLRWLNEYYTKNK